MTNDFGNFGSHGKGLDNFYNYVGVTGKSDNTKTIAYKDTTSISPIDTDHVDPMLYLATPGRPQLEKSTGTPSMAGFQEIDKFLQSFPADLLAAAGNLPTPEEDKFSDALDAEIDALGESVLSKIGNGDPAKGKAIVRHAALHNSANLPPELKAIAEGVLAKATAKAGNGPSPLVIAMEEKAISAQEFLSFQATLALSGLSSTEQNQINFAYFSPEAAEKLPQKLQDFLASAKAQAFEGIKKDYGLSDTEVITPDSAAFFKLIGSDYSTSVSYKIDDLGFNNGLSREKINELKTMFFTGSTDTPNYAELKPLLDGIIKDAKVISQATYGFPNDFQPSVQAEVYNAILTGTYLTNFDTLINTEMAGFSDADKTLIKNALFSKEGQEKLSPELSAKFNSIQKTAIAQLGGTHGISPTWVPDTELLAIGIKNMESPNMILARTQIEQGREWVDHGMKLLASLPPTPANQMLMSYLKAVNSVLIKMTEMLYEISMTEANLANMMNKIQNDAEIGRLKKQEKDLQEVMAKEKKAESMGPLKAIFMWIITLILIMFLGPLALVIIAAMLIKTVVETAVSGKDMGKALMSFDVISSITDTFEQIGKAIGGPFGNALAKIFSTLALIMLAVLCPMAVVADLMLGEGTFVKNLCKSLGIPKDVAEKLTMAIQIIAQVVAMVVMAVLSGGATLALSIAQIQKTIVQIALSVVRFCISMCTAPLKTLASVAMAIGSKILEMIVNVAKSLVNAAKSLLGNSSKLVNGLDDALSGIKEACKKCQEALKEVLKGADDGTNSAAKSLQKTIDKLDDSITTAQRETRAVSDLTKELDNLKDVQKLAKETLDKADDAARPAAQKALDSATDAVKQTDDAINQALRTVEKAQKEAAAFVEKFMNVTGAVKDVASAVVDIHTNLLDAQIIRMKAALEEAKILIEVFIKVMKDMVAKLMAMAKGAIGDIKEIGEQMQNMFAEASNVIQNLASVRA